MRASKTEKQPPKTTKRKTSHKTISKAQDPLQTQREIRLRAYYNFLDRQQRSRPGNELSDWLDAEKEIGSNRGAGS